MGKRRAIEHSEDELGFIWARQTMPRRELHALFVEAFDRPDVSLANLRSLCVRRGWMTGRTGRIEKGATPHNKGRKGVCAPGSEKGRVKQGNRPHTYRGPGHERICSKDGYVLLIVAETNPYTGAATRRVHKHRWLWEKANGPVPEGMRLKCLDGDKTNTDPSNWKAVPNALAPRLNGRFGRGYDRAPAELKPTILATAELEHALRERRRGGRGA
jgi:hypothetical protein